MDITTGFQYSTVIIRNAGGIVYQEGALGIFHGI